MTTRRKRTTSRKRSTSANKLAAQQLRAKEKALISKQKSEAKALQKRQREELQRFRKQAAILKRRNLAFIKANTAELISSDYRKRVIRELSKTGIFEGKVSVQKISKDEARLLKERGRVVRNKRVILDKTRREKIVKMPGSRHRAIKYLDKDLGEGYLELIPFENWEEYLEGLQEKWEDFEGNGYRLAFRLYGHLSREPYDDIFALLNKLREYSQPRKSLHESLAEDWQDVIQHLEIFRISGDRYDALHETRINREEKRRRKRKRTYKTRRIALGENQYQIMLGNKREEMRKRRASPAYRAKENKARLARKKKTGK